MNERRRKLVPVSSIFILQQGWAFTDAIIHAKCTDGLPADAIFISLTYDLVRDTYYFCYQSAEWDEVPNGVMLPTFSPTFTNLYVAPLLEQAEALIERYDALQDDLDCAQWLNDYRAFKKQTGYPDGS